LRKKGYKTVFVFLLTAVLLSSCSVTKYLNNNEYLVKKNNVKVSPKTQNVDISDLRSFIRPKPNKKILMLNLKVWAYYRNQKKPSKFNAWLFEKIGEPPSLYYKKDVEKSVVKMKRYLADVGYVNSKITYKADFSRKKAVITYNINLSKPYIIDTVKYDIPDTLLRRFVFAGLKNSLVKKGDVYNAYTLDDERDRITSELRNNGYYYFNRNYIQFVIDSNFNARKMDVTMHIFNRKDGEGEVSLPHLRCFIKNVYVTPAFNPVITKYDTVNHQIAFPDDSTYSYKFLCLPQKHMFRLSTFDQTIKIKPGLPYSAEDVQQTYRRLFNYSILSSVNILFDTVSSSDDKVNIKYLNSRVEMQPGKLNRFRIEAIGTNSSGDLGIRGNIVFLNKNIFKGAEVLQLSLLGGFEAQKLAEIPDSTNQDNGSSLFNTFEAGFNATIFFPRFVTPVKFNRFNLKYNPQTNLNVGFNYQRRPYYSRNIFNVGVGYSWNYNRFVKHLFTPVNINYVNIDPTPEFEKILEDETDQRLKEQYSDHMIFGLKYSYIYNNQRQGILGHFNYFRINVESSGNLLYVLDKIAGTEPDAEGFYNFLGVKYSQYVRIDFDYRHFFYFSEGGDMLAYRAVVGTAIPFLNSKDIPYEKGFYAGGANGMRGWRFRTLGPGGYTKISDYERVGDIQLETNLEYRFPVYKYLKSALFVDVGNIWTYGESSTFPGGAFKFDTFYKQFAADMGLGLRLDFSYFIFRFDMAVPVVNPAYPEGKRLRISFLQLKDIVGNFGIGYPF
jgi:outer membrane protein assembly factor BamA